MAKRSKSFRRYASGGNPRFSTLDAGLTAMRQQTDTQVRQLEKLSSQREKQDNIFVRALESKLAREAENRKEVYEIEEIAPRKMRADALETNNQRRQERFRQTIKEQEDLASTWGELSPTMAEASFKLASSVQDYVNIQNAADDYEDLIQSGYLDKLSKFNSVKEKEGQKVFSQATDLFNKKAAHYLKTGDLTSKKEAEVMLYQLKTRNPKLRDKIVADVKADIQGFISDTISMLEDPNSENPVKVDHTNVAKIIQFRGAEVCRQLGINPKSKSGLEIQKAFRKEGLKYEKQYTLGYEYNRDSKVVNDSVDLIKVSHQNNDYEGANNNWKIMSSTYSTLPVESRTGEWSVPINVNPKESFKDLAIELMHNPRYANNWTLFSEEVLGKNAANKYGYVIVNPEGDITKKHNRILGKHPTLENELLIEWGRIHEGVKKTEQKAIEAKQTADASEFVDKVKTGFYRKPENQGNLWKDFKPFQNNPVAIAALGRSLGFADESLDPDLLHNTLFKALRSGDTEAIVSAWISADESNQEINFAYESLGELAEVLHQPIDKLDNKLVKIGDAKLTSIIKDNALNKSRHFSVEGMDKEMASFIATYFIQNRNNYDTADQTYQAAMTELNAMLGIDADGNLLPPDSKTRIRGFGQFAHRVGTTGNNQVVFLSKLGTLYGNSSSGEVQGMLDGDMKAFDSRESKINYLVNVVANEAQDNFTDEALLEVFNSNGHIANHPLLEQIYPHLKKLKLTKKEFLDRVGFARSGEEGKDLFVQMTGPDWCESTYDGPKVISNLNDKIMSTCFSRYREQLGLEPWEAAMLGSSNLKVREYIINKLDKGEPDE